MNLDSKKDFPKNENFVDGMYAEVKSYIVVTARATGMVLFLIACIIAWDKLFG